MNLLEDILGFDGHKNNPEVNKLRFLLINSTDSSQRFGYVPLGIAYIAAVLEANGVFVKCVNYLIEDFSEEGLKALVLENDINIVGLSGFTPHIYAAYRNAKLVKQANPKIKVIMGGPHVTVLPQEALDNGADIAIKGEAEQVIYDLLPHLYNFDVDAISKVPGVYMTVEGKTVNNPRPPRITDLDSLPMPARHLFKGYPERYKNMLPLDLKKGWLSTTIVPSRGCSAHCVFCNKQVFGSMITARSPENVVGEIKYLVEKYGINEISMSDDFFTFDPERVKRICRLLIEAKLGIKWVCSNTRVDILDDEMYKLMKKSGCYRINFGIESGVQKIIDSIGKNISLAQVLQAIAMANKYNFNIVVNFIIGHHTETEEDIRETVRFAKSLDVDVVQLGINTPFPGTPLYKILKSDGNLLSEKWNEYNYSDKVLFKTKNLSQERIFELYKWAWKQVTIFNRKFIFRAVWKFLFDKETSWRQYYTAFQGLLQRIFLKKWL